MQGPAFVLILAGLFAVITAGASLQEMIKQAWLREERINTGNLLVPYLAMAAGLVAMMAGGLQIFGIPGPASLGVSLVFILGIGGFVWWRLNAELAGKGGSSW